LWNPVTREEIRSLGNFPDWSRVAFSPNGKVLVAGAGKLRMLDVATGKDIAALQTEQGILSFAFSPDGKTLATGAGASTILLWPVSDIYACDQDAKNANLETLWTDLGSDDLTKAYRAIGTLANRAKDALPLLRERVRPKVPAKPEVIARLLEDLDSDN